MCYKRFFWYHIRLFIVLPYTGAVSWPVVHVPVGYILSISTPTVLYVLGEVRDPCAFVLNIWASCGLTFGFVFHTNFCRKAYILFVLFVFCLCESVVVECLFDEIEQFLFSAFFYFVIFVLLLLTFFSFTIECLSIHSIWDQWQQFCPSFLTPEI